MRWCARSVVLSTICRSYTAYCRKERADSRQSMTYARDRATPLLLSGFRTLRPGQPYTYVLLYAHTHVRRSAASTYICVHTYRKYLHAHMTCRTQRRRVSSINSTIIKIDWINAIDTVCDCHRAYF